MFIVTDNYDSNKLPLATVSVEANGLAVKICDGSKGWTRKKIFEVFGNVCFEIHECEGPSLEDALIKDFRIVSWAVIPEGQRAY
jgi:hypothetical protein